MQKLQSIILNISRSAAEDFGTEMPSLVFLIISSKQRTPDDVCVLKNIYLFTKIALADSTRLNHLFTNVSFLYSYYRRSIHLICYRYAQSFHESSQELVDLFLLCVPDLK